MSNIKSRAEIIASYIIDSGCTVRAAAAKFGLSKSTVHKDVTQYLASYNPKMYADVREVLDKNRNERHMRGGLATREKYLSMRLIRAAVNRWQDDSDKQGSH